MHVRIDREAYLAHAAELTETEKRIRDEMMQWLPDEIIDCHAHCNLPGHVLGMSERTYGHMLSSFPSYTLEESLAFQALFYPGKAVRTLRFAKTFRGVDHRAANRYLLEHSPAGDRVALFGLPDDVGYTVEMLGHPRVSALKMYYSYLEPPASSIYGFFPPEVLEEAQARGLPIILHLPKVVTKCREDMRRLLRDFPRLRVVLAHLGVTKFVIPGLAESYAELAAHPQVAMDTSLVPSAEVAGLALRLFGAGRIMFGSDEPLHLLRAKAYEHPRLGQRIMTEYPYHWLDPEEHREFRQVAAGAPHSHWTCLLALRDAVKALPRREQGPAVQGIFCDNAKCLFRF